MKFITIFLFIFSSYSFSQSDILPCLNESTSCSLIEQRSNQSSIKDKIDRLSYQVLSQRIGIDLNNAYLGIVGAGENMQSLGGHAILIFTSGEDNISSGISYHYNFLQSEDPKENGSFVVIEEPALHTLEYYREQNRVTNLYKINISAVEVKKLALRVNDDKRKRDRTPIRDYDMLHNNCLTNIVKNINKSVTLSKDKIPSVWVQEGRKLSHKIMSGLSLSSNTPYTLAPILEDSHLFTFTRTYKNKLQVEVIEKIALIKNLKKLSLLCKWGNTLMEQFEKLILNKKLSKSQKPLDYLYSKTQKCLKNNQVEKDKIIQKFNYFSMLYNDIEFDYESIYPFP